MPIPRLTSLCLQFEITGYPAVWGKGEVTELLVVGATDNSGAPWYKSSRDLSGIPSVYAPGVDISCADALNGVLLKLLVVLLMVS